MKEFIIPNYILQELIPNLCGGWDTQSHLYYGELLYIKTDEEKEKIESIDDIMIFCPECYKEYKTKPL